MKPSVLNFLLDAAGVQVGNGIQGGNALRQLLEELGVAERLVPCDSGKYLRLALSKRQPPRSEDGRHVAMGELVAVFLERPSRLDQPARGICQALPNLSGQVFADLDEGLVFSRLCNPRAWLRLGTNDKLCISRFWFDLSSLNVWSIGCKLIAHALNTHDASCMISARSVTVHDCLQYCQRHYSCGYRETQLDRGWVSKKEVAKHLGISQRTLYAWVQRRLIPWMRIGRNVRFKLSEVDEAPPPPS